MNEKASKEEIRKDMEDMNALDALARSEGGILLAKSCLEDAMTAIDSVSSGYMTLTHIELISHCARLKERLDLYRVLKRIPSNRSIVQAALEEALEYEPD